MSNYYAPCFYRINFAAIPSYIELPWLIQLMSVNNNLVNTVNNKFFNTVNKDFLGDIKSSTQLDKHEVNTNVTAIHFIVNCRTKNTDLAISSTDNTSEEVLKENIRNFQKIK